MTIHDQQTEMETEAMLAKWLRHRAAALSALEKAAHELNEIRARDGVPRCYDGRKSDVDEDYFSSVVDECFAVIESLTKRGAHPMTPLYSQTYSESPADFRHRAEAHRVTPLEHWEPEHQPQPREVVVERPWSEVVAVLEGVQAQLRAYSTPDPYIFGSRWTPEQYAMFAWAAELLDPAINEARRLSVGSEHTNDRS